MELDIEVLTILVALAIVTWRLFDRLSDVEDGSSERLEAAAQESAPISPRELYCDKDHPLAVNDAVPPIEAIHEADPSFDSAMFLQRGLAVYETVVTAFFDGDCYEQRGLLSEEVFDTFWHTIGEREERGETVELSFIRLKPAAIVDAAITGGRAQITVRFESEFITVTRDGEGEVIAGDPTQTVFACDHWTFARQLDSSSSVWEVVATESPPAEPSFAVETEDLDVGAPKIHDRSHASGCFRACA